MSNKEQPGWHDWNNQDPASNFRQKHSNFNHSEKRNPFDGGGAINNMARTTNTGFQAQSSTRQSSLESGVFYIYPLPPMLRLGLLCEEQRS